jgi:hypothetical protein
VSDRHRLGQPVLRERLLHRGHRPSSKVKEATFESTLPLFLIVLKDCFVVLICGDDRKPEDCFEALTLKDWFPEDSFAVPAEFNLLILMSGFVRLGAGNVAGLILSLNSTTAITLGTYIRVSTGKSGEIFSKLLV